MRYFLDTEYNGFGGELLSLALVAEHGDEELYFTLPAPAEIHPWVERHVMPYMNTVPPMHRAPPLDRASAADALATFLANDRDIEIIADWPEDIAQICMLLLVGPGEIVRTPPLRFRFFALPGFSTAGASAVPHNALHDARALRDHVLSLEDN
ncbi:hypothetical protein [Sphingomonas sp.]|jgi:hypothetical protein|uniref:hypothetical protein n=1 Tax=Sphingomonas sp. TaxID=28214 RepID=UPI0025E3206D|nr:hypothetical protein [Sphingomonas sp.]